jgi:hypothetical protein
MGRKSGFQKVMRMLNILDDCPYRVGIAKKGRAMFRCTYANEEYDVSEMLVICTVFCPFKPTLEV